MDKPSEEVQILLKTICDQFDIEDQSVRERQIRTWRKLKFYWENMTRLYWSEVAHDWRVYDNQSLDSDTDAGYYDKRINVFRAYLESIIAALSVTVPAIDCAPDDADNALDLETAKAGSKIAELIYKHNDAPLLWLRALFIFCTEGMIAAYNYTKEDEEYGIYKENHYKDEIVQGYQCPECQADLPDDVFQAYQPDQMMDQEISDLETPIQDIAMCPECGSILDPDMEKTDFTVTKLVGVTEHPKSRQCIEVFGGLYVKVPNYARKQSDIPYLRFTYETHYANALARYPELRDKVGNGKKVGPGDGGNWEPYERWGRLSTQYHGEFPTDTCTIGEYWLRPQSYYTLNENDCEKLKKLYPLGCKIVYVNGVYAEVCEEKLDDAWTLSYNPLADYIHFDPLGLLLVSVQDITNDLVSLTVQTIEHGIPQTFADPGVLNFDQYTQQEVSPGSIFPALPKSGKSMGDAFYEVKTATLSTEVLPFGQSIQQMGQLVSGALPSLFGGGNVEGSKTASEYSMSRAQALQRLQNTWKMLSIWWKEIFGKVIPAYIESVVEDEKFVQKTKDGGWVNVFIRRAELQGKIGNVELEASEQLPITWSQKKDTIMQLMQTGNPAIMEALGSPENIPFIKQAIGIPEFIIPGEEDRLKQYDEIKQLLESVPLELPMNDPMTGIPIMDPMTMEPAIQPTPSIPIDPILDNHIIEAEICRRWLISESGRLAKVENPDGYHNVLLHFQAHQQQVMMQQAAMMANAEPQVGAKPGAASKEGKDEPVTAG